MHEDSWIERDGMSETQNKHIDHRMVWHSSLIGRTLDKADCITCLIAVVSIRDMVTHRLDRR